jgi:large subunit ribosomal protein L9
MQVILMDKVVNLGNLGDVVKVKDGYARNFLIPTGRARRATQANMEAFAAQKAELERIAADKLADAQRRGEKLEGVSVTISHKAGVDGRLFGSVTNADIADALKAQGHEVVKAEVRLPEADGKTGGVFQKGSPQGLQIRETGMNAGRET